MADVNQPSRRAADRLRPARVALACIIETGQRAGNVAGAHKSMRKRVQEAPLSSAPAAGSRKPRTGR